MAPKKPHPADQAEADKIARATHFAVHLRTGPYDKITKQGPQRQSQELRQSKQLYLEPFCFGTRV